MPDCSAAVILIIDGLDQADGTIAGGAAPYDNPMLQLVEEQLPKLPSFVRLVLTARPLPYIVPRLASKLSPLELPSPEALRAARPYERNVRLALGLTDPRVSRRQRAAAAAMLLSRSGGSSLYVKLALGCLQLDKEVAAAEGTGGAWQVWWSVCALAALPGWELPSADPAAALAAAEEEEEEGGSDTDADAANGPGSLHPRPPPLPLRVALAEVAQWLRAHHQALVWYPLGAATAASCLPEGSALRGQALEYAAGSDPWVFEDEEDEGGDVDPSAAADGEAAPGGADAADPQREGATAEAGSTKEEASAAAAPPSKPGSPAKAEASGGDGGAGAGAGAGGEGGGDGDGGGTTVGGPGRHMLLLSAADRWSCCVAVLRTEVYGRVLHVAVHPAGRLLATVHAEGRGLLLWDPWEGRLLGAMDGSFALSSGVRPTAALFTPDGSRLLCAARSVYVWDVATGRLLSELNKVPAKKPPAAAAAKVSGGGGGGAKGSPAGGAAASGRNSGSGRGSSTIVAAAAAVVTSRPGTATATVTSRPGTATAAAAPVAEADEAETGADPAAAAVDGGSGSGSVRGSGSGRDSGTGFGAAAAALPYGADGGDPEGPITALAMSPDGSRVAAGHASGTSRVWDLSSGKLLAATWMPHRRPVTALAFSRPAGATLVVAHGEGGGAAPAARAPVAAEELADVPTALLRADDLTLHVWKVVGSNPKELEVLKGHTGRVSSLVFSTYDGNMVTGSADETVRTWWDDPKTPQSDYRQIFILGGAGQGPVGLLRGLEGPVVSLCFSGDGRILAAADSSDAGVVRLFDVGGASPASPLHASPATGRGGLALRGGHRVGALSLSPDGRRLAVVSDDLAQETLRVLDVLSGRKLAVMGPGGGGGHEGKVNAVAWSADGSRLATGSDDLTVRVWFVAPAAAAAANRKGNRKAGEPSAAAAAAAAGAASGGAEGGQQGQDGSEVGGEDGEDGEVALPCLPGCCQLLLSGHHRKVQCVAWANKGDRLASGGYDQMVRIWDSRTGEQVMLIYQTTWVSSLVFSPDDARLVTGAAGRSVHLFNSATGKQLAGQAARQPAAAKSGGGGGEQTEAAAGGEEGGGGGEESWVAGISINPDGTLLAVRDQLCCVSLWDVGGPARCRQVRTLEGAFREAAFCPATGDLLLFEIAASSALVTHAIAARSLPLGRSTPRSVAPCPPGVDFRGRAGGTAAGHSGAVRLSADNRLFFFVTGSHLARLRRQEMAEAEAGGGDRRAAAAGGGQRQRYGTGGGAASAAVSRIGSMR
ncbi:hypothetical protein GPECTOR_13g651 [Gonium pectorale]|uniref:Anaphase-promoting complex subunit 4 WD40 domain-containing protein n=1 Tax=Gonium pectorale TaxID=33097 RepID=A0A150GMZ2_GONPE|nr:hypothetical protein GPECTOR_13g651 [Gonium pectorale]|eukprot:KXZ51164.1 hypothetical protein GPECTOR_13g651 [Gonium pectorale]